MTTDLDAVMRDAKAALEDAMREREQAQLHMGYCEMQVSNARADVLAIERTRALAGTHARAREAALISIPTPNAEQLEHNTRMIAEAIDRTESDELAAAMDAGLAAARSSLSREQRDANLESLSPTPRIGTED